MTKRKVSDIPRLKIMPSCTRITINENMTEDDIFEQLSNLYRFEFDQYFEVLNDMFIIQLWAGDTDKGTTTSFPHKWYHKAIEYSLFEIAIYDRSKYLSDDDNYLMPLLIKVDGRLKHFSWAKVYFESGLGDYVPIDIVIKIIKDCARVSRLAVFS